MEISERLIRFLMNAAKLRNTEIELRRIPYEEEQKVREQIRQGKYRDPRLKSFEEIESHLGTMAVDRRQQFIRKRDGAINHCLHPKRKNLDILQLSGRQQSSVFFYFVLPGIPNTKPLYRDLPQVDEHDANRISGSQISAEQGRLRNCNHFISVLYSILVRIIAKQSRPALS